jgi:F-type H+-transporting ATPase subunit b
MPTARGVRAVTAVNEGVTMTVPSMQAVAEGSGQLERIATTFGVDWPHLIAQTVSFGIVCAVLYLLAYKPILQMLEARRQQIASGLANAEKIKAELARIAAEREAVLMRADAEGKQLIEEARVAAARVQASETRKAIAAAEQILIRARDAAARDHARMLADVKHEVGRLVVQTTAAVTGKILTAEDHVRLAEETASRLAS